MGNPFENDYASQLKRLMEEQNHLTRFIDHDLLRHTRLAMETASRWAQEAQLAKSAILESCNYRISSVFPSQIHGSIGELIQNLEEEFSCQGLAGITLKGLYRPAIERELASVIRLQDSLSEITKATQSLYKEALAPSRYVQSALATMEAFARSYSRPDSYWRNTLSLVEEYERFALRQAKYSIRDLPTIAHRRGRVTELAGTLLAPSIGASEAAALEFGHEDLVEIEPVKPRLFGPLNSHLGYVYKTDFDGDVDVEVAASLPSRISHTGAEIIDTVVKINQTTQRSGGEDVFKPTNRTLKAASLIPTVVADSESSFAEIIDGLYFLLYEGAGSANLRLCGMASDDDLTPLWHLKQLRLHFRHDIEHGNKSSVLKKYEKIDRAFMAIIGTKKPKRSSEWVSAQLNLYEQLLGMLEIIYEAIA